ncbi:hypothetical protein COJ90_21115 [Priestia megaterium]|uniref:hypothetical protein n=1 Tax=Priestia megaterium TaxID=1404 RepID=UPI000BF5BB5B|nr:hypothetical protein [Priestia megaterium]PFP09216.1 hypothetical protein COJ90_21115 [Priestia megaterium]
MGRVYFIILLIILSLMPVYWHISLNVVWLIALVILLFVTVTTFIKDGFLAAVRKFISYFIIILVVFVLRMFIML